MDIADRESITCCSSPQVLFPFSSTRLGKKETSTVYADRSFTFITKTPPTATLIMKAVGVEKGSGEPNKNKVATITKAQLKEIAERKMPDLNAATIEAAMSNVAGTCRSMGITVVD